jgi:hypothetical protein
MEPPMSGAELAAALHHGEACRIDATAFSGAELLNAAETACSAGSTLILYNTKRLTLSDVRRLAETGGRQVIFDDVRLI